MKPIRLLAIGEVEPVRLDSLCRAMAAEFNVACSVAPQRLDPAPTFHAERQQYHSTEMLEALCRTREAGAGVALGLTPVDLYIPILTFVFGEAQLNGSCALVSYHRLRQEFYGLPPDEPELERRIIKEGIHEVGHTLGLHHCEDYACAMASSHSVEWIDLKEPALCDSCRAKCRLGPRKPRM